MANLNRTSVNDSILYITTKFYDTIYVSNFYFFKRPKIWEFWTFVNDIVSYSSQFSLNMKMKFTHVILFLNRKFENVNRNYRRMLYNIHQKGIKIDFLKVIFDKWSNNYYVLTWWLYNNTNFKLYLYFVFNNCDQKVMIYFNGFWCYV